MKAVLQSLAFHIAIDPSFFAPYSLVLGTLSIELICRSLPLNQRQRRYTRWVAYPTLALSILALFLLIGPPLSLDLARTEIEQPFEASFGEQVQLVGYAIDDQAVSPGDALELRFYMYALQNMGTDYSLFVHLVDADGTLIAQDDHQPVADNRPTSHWLRGELIRDVSRLQLPLDIPVGEYRIVIGLYQWQTGERLPAYAGEHRAQDDAIVLPASITIVDS